MFFIVNPFSGTSTKEGIEQLIEKTIDKNAFDIDIKFTEGPNHATELARNASQNQIKYIVSVGGDGTVNEIAKALTHSNSIMGVLPAGSGNGFAMHLGFGRNIEKALIKLNKVNTEKIDTCTVNDQFYINVAGVGYDGLIADKIKNDPKRGFRVYLKNSIKEASSYQNQNYIVQYNNQTIEGKYLSINVANASMFGYKFTIAPQANLQDQLLDLIMVKDAAKFKYLLSGWRALNKTIHKSNLVDSSKVKEVIVSSDKPLYYHIDGEGLITEGSLHFKIDPLSLNVIVP